MADEIAVSFAELEALGGQITSTSSQVESELDSLRQQISNLQNLWIGGAGEAFQHTKAQWDQAAEDLKQVLASIGAAVSAAEQQYRATETKNTSAWG